MKKLETNVKYVEEELKESQLKVDSLPQAYGKKNYINYSKPACGYATSGVTTTREDIIAQIVQPKLTVNLPVSAVDARRTKERLEKQFKEAANELLINTRITEMSFRTK